MKKIVVIALAFAVSLCFATGTLGADRDAIKNQVDDVVVAVNGGKAAAEFADMAKKDPYVFIMEAGGRMLTHPTLTGQSLKDKAAPVYDELVKGTPAGVWVDYKWKGKMKHTYVRTTGSGLIVGSGYSD